MADNDSVFHFCFISYQYIYIFLSSLLAPCRAGSRHHSTSPFLLGCGRFVSLSCKAAHLRRTFFAVCTWHRMACHIQGESNNTESIGVPGHAVCITSTYLSISQDLGLLSPSKVARGTCIIGHSHGSDQCLGIPADWPQGGLRSAVADRRYHWNWGHCHCHGL